jgi:hypothetical protein
MKNSNDTIGNQTRNLPTCSAVPPTLHYILKFIIIIIIIIIITTTTTTTTTTINALELLTRFDPSCWSLSQSVCKYLYKTWIINR